LQFLNVPLGATIRIFDAAGGYINTVTPNRRLDTTQTGTADWNLRDSDGKQVVSGIYIFKVDAGGGSKVGRFIVVR
jgi:signal transduction histidine kinase